MRKQIFLLLITIFVMTSCVPDTQMDADKENGAEIFTQIYSTDNLEIQSFTIVNEINNIITGAKGTIIRINKNTFVDQGGDPVKGKVIIKLVEVLSPVDRVLGNLTTTFKDQPLETGGMIFIDAISGSRPVSIAADKSILVKMPTDSTLTNMSLFEGRRDSAGISWLNPAPIPQLDKSDSMDLGVNAFEKTTNVRYMVDGFDDAALSPQHVQNEVGRIAWAGDGLKISKDSTFKIGEYTVHFIKQEKLDTWSESFQVEKGRNSFAEDLKTNYIFSVKKLGWANIDRLLEDPRTTEVEFITTIENQKDFKYVYVTLITQQMYIPGYQKKDDTYCFSHGDEEKQRLPVGESATILATAYKNDKPYFAIKKIRIDKKQSVSFKLIETTKDKLKTDLQNQI